MMRELRWEEQADESRLVRVTLDPALYGAEMEPFDCLADSLYLFDGMSILHVEPI